MCDDELYDHYLTHGQYENRKVREISKGYHKSDCECDDYDCTSKIFTDLKIGGDLSVKCNLDVGRDTNICGKLTIKPKEKLTIEVGEDCKHKTIQSVIDEYYGTHMGRLTIKVKPGCYVENIDLSNTTSKEATYSEFFDYFKGVRIIGDERLIVGHSYVNNHELSTVGNQQGVRVSTDQEGLGPYAGVIANFSGPINFGSPVSGLGGIYDPIEGCSAPSASDLNGKVALIRRCTCAFITKAANAETSGAVATIIYNSFGIAIGMAGTLHQLLMDQPFLYLTRTEKNWLQP